MRVADALVACSSQCEALTHGATVRIDEHTVYQPDALVHCNARLEPDAIEITDPILVVEVLSPTTSGMDTTTKLEGDFRLRSMSHYLIVRTDRPTVVHHRRDEGGTIVTQIHRGSVVQLDPPGIQLDLQTLFA